MSRVPEHVEDRQGLYIVARRVLLDALVALRDQSDAITIVGAQAIYLQSAEVRLSVASYTSDADLGLDPERLVDEPLLEQAMTNAGFVRGGADHAGSWTRAERVGGVVADIAVDLLVPKGLSKGGRRSVKIPPHDKMSARRVSGLEAAVVDTTSWPWPAWNPTSTSACSRPGSPGLQRCWSRRPTRSRNASAKPARRGSRTRTRATSCAS